MPNIPGGVRFTGFVAPTDTTDTYPVTDPLYGIDGLRSVADHTERDAITAQRRRQGMVVYTRSDGKYWSLDANLTSWIEFVAGAPGTVWYEGSGIPSDLIGINGDFYLNVATGDVYQKESGWGTPVGNIAGPGSPPGGSDKQVQFNDGGSAFGGDAGFTYDKALKSVAFGSESSALGNTCYAGNSFCLALGDDSHAQNTSGVAVGTSSHAEGNNSLASGYTSHAEGSGTAGTVSNSADINGVTLTVTDNYATSYLAGRRLAMYGMESGSPVFATIAMDAVYDIGSNITTITITEPVALGATVGVIAVADAILYAHAEGGETVASGNFSHAQGLQTTASGVISHAEGQATTASGQASHAQGGLSLTSLQFQHASSDGGFDSKPGSGQYSIVSVSGISTDVTPIKLLIGAGGGFLDLSGKLTIRNNFTYAFTAHICGRSAAINNHAYFIRQGVIANNGGTTALVGSVATIGTDNNGQSWVVSITADDTNDALQIQVTGDTTTIRWFARVDLIEIGLVAV